MKTTNSTGKRGKRTYQRSGDNTDFGFSIPKTWPRWKVQCSAHHRSRPDVRCKNWAIRGMPTCRKHGSGGAKNARLGLIRYMSWIVTGCPQDTPVQYARFVALAVALEMLFNNGKGSEELRFKAIDWILSDSPRADLDIRDVLSTDDEGAPVVSSN